jgi:two-component system nitrate/nitrite response regulator NarL
MQGSDGDVKVVVADDQPVFVRGLAAILDGPFAVLAAVRDHSELRSALARRRPDVTVLGLSGPGAADEPWLDAVPVATRAGAVLALTDSRDGARIRACVRAGVRSIAPRSIGTDDLVEAIRRVAAGEIFLGAGAVEAMMREVARLSAPAGAPLTARELQILRMLADGLKTPAIAAALVVERTTIKTHLHHLFEKLGVSNQAAAVAEGMRRDLLG